MSLLNKRHLTTNLTSTYHLHSATMPTASLASKNRIQSALSIPAANADLETVWRFLEEGMDHIMSGDQISYARNMELYTVIYHYMTSMPMKGYANDQVRNAQSNVLVNQLQQMSLIHLSFRECLGFPPLRQVESVPGASLGGPA